MIAKVFLGLVMALWVYNLFRILKLDANTRRAGIVVPRISLYLKVVHVVAIAFNLVMIARLP